MPDQPFGALQAELPDVVRQEEPAQCLGGEPAVILAEVAHFAGVEVDVARGDDLFATLAFVMHDLGGRQVDDTPARVLESLAPVQFFRIHKVSVVHQAHLRDGLLPGHHGRSFYPIHVERRIVGLVLHVVVLQHAAGGIGLQPSGLEEGGR